MRDLAERIAPEIDRLVIGINRQVGPRHGRVLLAIANELKLDSLKLVPHVADFLLDGSLPAETALARLPYAAPGAVTERLNRFVELGLVSETADGLEATPRFRLMLVAAVATREDVVVRTWDGHETTIERLESVLHPVIERLPEGYTVANAHRRLTESPEPAHRLYNRLVTLRYVRQHDHVEAWRGHGLTAPGMLVLTPLWRGEAAPADAQGWDVLESRGLVAAGELTREGRHLRDQIELDTNRTNAAIWTGLDQSVIGLVSSLPETAR